MVGWPSVGIDIDVSMEDDDDAIIEGINIVDPDFLVMPVFIVFGIIKGACVLVREDGEAGSENC